MVGLETAFTETKLKTLFSEKNYTHMYLNYNF